MTTHTLPEALQRHPDEPSGAHRALVDYAILGAARSLDLLAERYRSDPDLSPPTRRRGTLGEWSTRWAWAERVAAYDEALAAAELAEAERRWHERREQAREEGWVLAERLLERARELLAHPVTEQTEERTTRTDADGRIVEVIQITIRPARWSHRDIATLAETFTKLARLAAGMDTAQQRLVVDGLEPQDLGDLSDEELERLEKKLAQKRR